MNVEQELAGEVACHIELGCSNMSASLGIQKMPQGYALMLNADQTHFYWLRHDGIESQICWDKWAVYRGAKKNETARESAEFEH